MPPHFSSPGREAEENRGDSSIHSVQGKGKGKRRGRTGGRRWWGRNDFKTGKGRIRGQGSLPLSQSVHGSDKMLMSSSLTCTCQREIEKIFPLERRLLPLHTHTHARTKTRTHTRTKGSNKSLSANPPAADKMITSSNQPRDDCKISPFLSRPPPASRIYLPPQLHPTPNTHPFGEVEVG